MQLLSFHYNGSVKVSTLLTSPFRRLSETPEIGVITATAMALWQYAAGEPFLLAMVLVMVTAFVDYIAGSVTAHRLGEWKSGLAYNGALSKLLGLVLVMLVRGLEGFLALTTFLDTNGALATAAAVSLITVDIVSISKHRSRLGGEPIPFVTALTDWIQSALLDKLPGKKKTDQ